MNLSHTYAAPKPKSYVGVSLVVALHVAAMYAFSAGLIHPPTTVKEPAILLPPIPEPPRQPEVVREPYKPDAPTLTAPKVEVPVPPIWEDAPVVRVTEQPKGETPPVIGNTGGTGGTGTFAGPTNPPAEPAIRSAGAVCSVMPHPEMPALNWTGEAVLQVMATVRGGRVVGTEFRVTQGALDSKTKRALQRSAESALAGYQCQGDATFQQDFAFRLD